MSRKEKRKKEKKKGCPWNIINGYKRVKEESRLQHTCTYKLYIYIQTLYYLLISILQTYIVCQIISDIRVAHDYVSEVLNSSPHPSIPSFLPTNNKLSHDLQKEYSIVNWAISSFK